MPITSFRDNENNRWERIAKKKTTNKQRQKRKEQGGQKLIVKGWEINDFVV